MTRDEIAAHLGVDSLGYLSLDGMLESVPDGPRRLLPRMLLRRLSNAAAHRSRQAPIRLRVLNMRAGPAAPERSASQTRRVVYFFGNGKAEGTRRCARLLGGKGANLAEMTNLGVPVPPGFTIACSLCVDYLAQRQRVPTRCARRGRRRRSRGSST